MKRDNVAQMLTFVEEKSCQAQGYLRVAGIDEVGRGCIAGPVAAAAVIMPWRKRARWFKKVNDSKLLTPQQRELLFPYIQEAAIAIGVGTISHEIINSQGIARATRLAMQQAVEQIAPPPEYLLLDYVTLPDVPLPQKGIVDGDSLCFSIACASIIAKVSRDRLMVELDSTYPGYGFAQHKGYGTKEHLACLHKLGPSPIHRTHFQPVKDVLANWLIKPDWATHEK